MNSPAETAARQPYPHTAASVTAFARTLPVGRSFHWSNDGDVFTSARQGLNHVIFKTADALAHRIIQACATH